jgi:1,4-alpha-glucan branching enzyme
MPSLEARTFPHRFVIYQPEVEKVEIAGSFTQWQTVPMNRIGSSGYWDLILDLPRGEHRFTYLLEGNRRIVDPTVPTREKDDFGGENSVLSVES